MKIQELRQLLSTAERSVLEKAYAQNYLVPNREVPKSQRPKWRFMVKNYIKELEKLSLEDDNYAKSVTILTSLYRALRLMEWIDEDELWLQIYEYGLKQKIKPRDVLKKEYERRKQR